MAAETNLKEGLTKALNALMPYYLQKTLKSKIKKSIDILVKTLEEYIDERIYEHEETKNHPLSDNYD